MYAVLRRAAPLRRRAVSALAAALLQQQPAALGAAVAPRPAPTTLPAAAAAWFHSSPAWLGFRETGAAGAAARAQFAAEEGSFYEEDKRAPAGGGAAAEEGLEIAKLGISSKIVERLASKGITKLFPIQVTRAGIFTFRLVQEESYGKLLVLLHGHTGHIGEFVD